MRRSLTTQREGGQAMVELAVVMSVLVMILFAVVEFGNAFWTYQQVSAAANAGARAAAVSKYASSPSNSVSTAAKAASGDLTSSKMDVDTTSTWAPGSIVTVDVSYDVAPVGIDLLGTFGFDGTLSVRRTAQVDQ